MEKKNVHNVEHVMRETFLYNSGLWSTSTEQNPTSVFFPVK